MRKLIPYLKKISFHPDPRTRLAITLVYCGVGIFVNFFCLQVFCMPVMYAGLMCIAFFMAVVSFPFIRVKWMKAIGYFLLGIGVPICAYCACFLGEPLFLNYIYFILEILLFGAGLLAFIPFYLLRHIYVYYKGAEKGGKRLLWLGVIVPLFALLVYLVKFQSYLTIANKWESKSSTTAEFMSHLPGNYFTERILGLHWKYHTRLEYIYDGWRPPMHDPFLIIGLRIHPDVWWHIKPSLWPRYGGGRMDAPTYYHSIFPDKPVKSWCPCAYSYDGVQYLDADFDKVGHAHAERISP